MSEGYAFPVQFWVQSAAHGLRVREVPVRLIYNNPNRSFGGPLDDAGHRLEYYRRVFEDELAKFPGRFKSDPPCACEPAGSLGSVRVAGGTEGGRASRAMRVTCDPPISQWTIKDRSTTGRRQGDVGPKAAP